MKTQNTTPRELCREFGPVGRLFAWTDRHPRTAAALLWLQAAAILAAVILYDFTTK